MSGTITTSISFDIDTLNDANTTAKELGISRSRFIQLSVRNQIKLHKKQTIHQFLDSLNSDELETLKDIVNN